MLGVGGEDSHFVASWWLNEVKVMSAWRQVFELAIEEEDLSRLRAIARSRTEPASWVVRAQMLLAYRDNPSCSAVGRALGVHHQTVQRCVERAVAYGPLAALDDLPRPGKERTITAEARAWLVDLACRKAKDLGYPHELWTTRLLALHAREHGPAAGHGCLAKLAQGTVCKILSRQAIKAHKVRYYLERRDAEFEEKMAQVLCVYREVAILKKAVAADKEHGKPVAIVSYDEKPGIQAIATTSPDLPPKPGRYASFARDHEYKRHGTVSLLAGIDLLNGRIHALAKDRHRSREFIEFLKLLDAAYPADTAIKLILDNHPPTSPGRRRLGSPLNRTAASPSPSPPSTARGSTSSRASSPSSLDPSCATSGSPPNRSSRTASWLPWTTSIACLSSTLGLTNSPKQPDMIRIKETIV
jgi:transposase